MRAMVIGGNGQDGHYLCRSLIARGHDVVSVDLASGPRLAPQEESFRYEQCDLRDADRLVALLVAHEPELIFHFAAVHASADGAPYEERFGAMLDVNVGSVHVVLEHLRQHADGARLIYASSVKAFGDPLPAEVDETTPRRSTCLYGITKNSAHDLVAYYRTKHDVQASVVLLFNHESPLRPPDFFIPKLARGVASAIASRRDGFKALVTTFRSLDFFCDWGSAEEYADIIVDVLERAPSEDIVLATGRSVHARELAEKLFARHGLKLSDHVRESSNAATAVAPPSRVDLSKLRGLIGRVPDRSIEDVLEEMITIASAEQT